MATVQLPDHYRAMLDDGAHLISSSSGGKDSQAMTIELARLRQEHGWAGRFVVMHCDVGRMEWQESLAEARGHAEAVGAEFVAVEHAKYDLFSGIKARRVSLDAKGDFHKPHWPSSAARWCTRGWKTATCDKWIRNEPWVFGTNWIVAIGIRAEESSNRAKKPIACDRDDATAETLGRYAYTWHPIHQYKLADVWATIGYTVPELREIQAQHRSLKQAGDLAGIVALERAFKAHPAYARGNERVSCALCVLASPNDLRNGAEYQPDTYRLLVQEEIDTGFSFRDGLWLGDLASHLLSEDMRQALDAVKQRKAAATGQLKLL
jgi:3'-phosphoadenosine 5'-phosphosulfate sulfotransferase (PAPS reductase)/FAD synthetase